MIAAAIAYLLAGLFTLFGLLSIIVSVDQVYELSASRLRLMVSVGVVSLFVAWGWAYLGGI